MDWNTGWCTDAQTGQRFRVEVELEGVWTPSNYEGDNTTVAREAVRALNARSVISPLPHQRQWRVVTEDHVDRWMELPEMDTAVFDPRRESGDRLQREVRVLKARRPMQFDLEREYARALQSIAALADEQTFEEVVLEKLIEEGKAWADGCLQQAQKEMR